MRNAILDISSAPAFQLVTLCYKTEEWAYWKSDLGNTVFCSYTERKYYFYYYSAVMSHYSIVGPHPFPKQPNVLPVSSSPDDTHNSCSPIQHRPSAH